MSASQTSNVTSKGQVTVPVDIRRELGIKPGGKVRFVRKGKQIVLQAVEEQPISSLFGIVKVRKGRHVPDVDQALEEMRQERFSRHRQPAGKR